MSEINSQLLNEVNDKFISRILEAEAYAEFLNKQETKETEEGIYNTRNHLKIGCSTLYIMLYSSIEIAIKEMMAAAISEIASSGATMPRITLFWRKEIMKLNYLKQMQEGTNNAQIIESFCIDAAIDGVLKLQKGKGGRTRRNIGYSDISRIIADLSLCVKSNLNATAGDIETIRTRRNALSHGDESFVDAGSVTSISDIIIMIGRINEAIQEIIKATDHHLHNKKYLIEINHPFIETTPAASA